MPIDPQDLADWFDAHAPAMILYARQWVTLPAAEDIVQDIFLRAAAQGRRLENPRAWLLACTRNAAIDALRHRQREQDRQRDLSNRPLFASHPGAAINDAEAQALLARLGPQEREIITLRIWAESNFEEIADILNIPLSTVYHRYRAALVELRDRLEEPCQKK